MAGMELLQFHALWYSALREVSAEFDASAALNRGKAPLFYWLWGSGGQFPSGDFEKEKRYYLLPRLIARQLGCPAIPQLLYQLS